MGNTLYLVLGTKRAFFMPVSEVLLSSYPKNRVREQFFIHFHVVFLRKAIIRRTFALAIGTQAMLALPDTPLGESVWYGGSQTAQLQRYLK